jgi:hypothetical protein
MNTPLHTIQSLFQQDMLGGGDADALLSGTAERRRLGLDVYRHAYRQRLVEALADAYGKTQALLGAPRFERNALRYIAARPPTTRNLRWYGADFAEHLEAQHPASAELARFEWALRDAFDGPDSTVLAAHDLSGVPAADWATLTLVPVPTAQLLSLAFNTVAVWQALDDEQAPPDSLRSARSTCWLVWRIEPRPHFRSLGAAEEALLRAMLGGASFAAACDSARPVCEDAAVIGSCLRRWLDEGLLTACR